jgi:thioredoxin reductase/pSer/pThr/pTyr-binding forkhead associated (FHA) protein/ferredoxin
MAEKIVDSDYTTFGTLKVEGPTPLPDVLDLLVAGGGPAGTAAAVRCKEFGLSCLVVDYDDLMKRIRDYPKEKLIKPGYGGGDKLQFPAGGPKLQTLHFDDIDKDEMVVQWKQRYKEFGISAKIGSELTGLRRAEDGTWEARTWSHRAGKEISYRARNVLIAIGAGVPRRFDIPGNTEGLSFRLDDAAQYVGAPALVIGGGTSAAEAVISISNAKAAAEDASPIYWSYRGDRLPKVSKALSEVFFDAYIGNGNIRYLPLSEPIAVLPGPDKKDYLSIRIDRKEVVGRPAETVALEFPKDQVVACIGEDLPVKLLQGLGIKVPLVNNRPLMLVDQKGQTNLAGVFLVGDARGPKYLRCTDFDDSTTYEQITQKRNIKAAMVEAVEVVEFIASAAGAVAARVEAVQPAAVVPPTPSEPADSRPEQEGVQILSLQPDGTVEETFPSTKATITIGRGGADVSFPDDVYMADHHATIREQGGRYVLEDTGAGSGIWLRAQGVEGRPLAQGDNVWIGAQILVVTKEGAGFGIAHYDREGVYRATYPIGDRGAFVGRRADVTLDPNDLSLSRRHAQFRIVGNGLQVFDLGSTNGTFVRLSAPAPLENGAEFRVGSKRFRFETFAPVAKLAASDVVVEAAPEPAVAHPEAAAAPAEAPAAAAAAPAAAAPAPAAAAAAPAPAAPAAAAPAAAPAGAGGVTIDHPEYPCSFDASPSEDILHAYFANLKARFPDCKVSKKGEPSEHMDEPLGWECKVGLCGLCTVEILEGADNFLPPDPGSPEMNTIENKAFLDPDPKKYRLTCLAKVKGPVKLAIPS